MEQVGVQVYGVVWIATAVNDGSGMTASATSVTVDSSANLKQQDTC